MILLSMNLGLPRNFLLMKRLLWSLLQTEWVISSITAPSRGIVLGGSGEPLGLRSSGIYSWAYWALTGSLLAYAFRSGESWYDISYDQGYYSLSALL